MCSKDVQFKYRKFPVDRGRRHQLNSGMTSTSLRLVSPSWLDSEHVTDLFFLAEVPAAVMPTTAGQMEQLVHSMNNHGIQ
jgi:hypothetical protein